MCFKRHVKLAKKKTDLIIEPIWRFLFNTENKLSLFIFRKFLKNSLKK